MAQTQDWSLRAARGRKLNATARGVRSARRLAVALAILGASAWSPASADPVVCASLSYTIGTGSEQTVVDDCWVSSNWKPQGGVGPTCDGPNDVLEVCVGATVSHPMP